MAFARSRGTDTVKFSCWRAHGSQYWWLNARRGDDERLAPPRCSKVPANRISEPARISTGVSYAASASLGTSESAMVVFATCSSSQAWLPPITSVPPLAAVKSSSAQIVETLTAGRGRGSV